MKAIAKSFLSIGTWLPEVWIPPVGQTWRALDSWLGLSMVTQRKWSARLPAVGAAGVILAVYAWFAGMGPLDIRWALGLGLIAAILRCYSED